MKSPWPRLFAVGIVSLAFARPALAAAPAETRIDVIERQLEALAQELADLKARQAAGPPVAPPSPSQPEPTAGPKPNPIPDGIPRITVLGAFRYRHEYTDDETQVTARNRDRIGLHVGFTARINPELDVLARLASGNNAAPVLREEAGSPTSANQDLDDAFSRKNIWIDLACLAYHPTGLEGLDLLAGKMKNPFFTPGRSDLLLDRDVTPEGGALTYRTRIRDAVTLFGSAGGFWVEERSTSADTNLWAFQGGVTVPVPGLKSATATAGAGYHGYGRVQGRSALGPAGSFFGNRSDRGVYASDFDIWQSFAEIGFPLFQIPCTIFSDVLKNTSAGTDEDSGYYVGLAVGKCGKPGSWEFLYNYRDLEADAVLGALTEATFAGGGTNVRGHTFSLGYQLLKGLLFVATYMPAERTNTPTGVTTDHNALLLDLVAKF